MLADITAAAKAAEVSRLFTNFIVTLQKSDVSNLEAASGLTKPFAMPTIHKGILSSVTTVPQTTACSPECGQPGKIRLPGLE